MNLERERQVKALLESWGWTAIRAAKGPVDVVACVDEREAHHPLAPDHPILIVRGLLFVQVKATSGGPYSHFLPEERLTLKAMAARAGAEAWLCWWPPHRKPTWIEATAWPTHRREGYARAA